MASDARQSDERDRGRGERVTSALFVDFDNVFGGLFDLDRKVGIAFAESPEVWLRSLTTYGLESDYRDVLVRRVYLNPAGWVPDPEGNDGRGRLFLQKFRPYLTQAGFEVVDCPALTSKYKNAADIRIVIDVLDALQSGSRYDEIIIGSSDADFTPLLQRIRSMDRRTVIMSASTTSPAYRNIAHRVLEAEDVIDLISGTNLVSIADRLGAGPQSMNRSAVSESLADDSPVQPSTEISVAKDIAEKVVSETIDASDRPVLLADLGVAVRGSLKKVNSEPANWFGFGTLAKFVRSIDSQRFEASGHYAWEPDRHEAPVGAQIEGMSGLPPVVNNLCKVTDLPRLSSATWKMLFRKLIEYAHGHTFNLTECTMWVRDELADSAHPVGRQAVGYVVRALAIGGASLASTEPPKVEACVNAVAASVSDRASAAGLNLSDHDNELLRTWLRGEGTEVSEATASG